MDIKDRVALVTGSGKKGRMGHALAIALASKGAHVVVHYGRSKNDAEEVAKEVRGHGVQALTYGADLRDQHALENMLHVADEIGPVSILVNSASGFAEDTLSGVTPTSFENTLAVTLHAPVFLTQAFARALPADMKGAVVNITDARVDKPYSNHFSYMIGKGALNQFTLTAARELGPQVRVNGIALGAILPPPGETEEYLEDLVAPQPIPEAGGTKTVVMAIEYLLDNDFVTGEIVRVDGGAHLL